MIDKERLEIIKFLRNSEKTVAPGMQPSELISRKDVDWLINRVEALEEIKSKLIQRWNDEARLNNDLMEQNQRYKQALEFYADENNYREHDLKGIVPPRPIAYKPILHDYGSIARQALERDEN